MTFCPVSIAKIVKGLIWRVIDPSLFGKRFAKLCNAIQSLASPASESYNSNNIFANASIANQLGRIAFAFSLTLCTISGVKAETITSRAVIGNWNAASSWVGGVIPGSGSDVIIVSGATITVTASSSARSLDIIGIIEFKKESVFTIAGDITVESSGTFNMSGGAATLLVYGNYTNFGTTDFWKSDVIIAGNFTSPSTSEVQNQGRLIVGGNADGIMKVSGNGGDQVFTLNPNNTGTIKGATPSSTAPNSPSTLVNYINTVIYGNSASCGFTINGPENSSSCIGGSVSFSIISTTAVSPTYQWEVNPGSGWEGLSNGDVYSNVENATLNIPNTTGMNGNIYRCKVTNNVSCSKYSYAGTLTITALPVNTVALSSAAATSTQTSCINMPIIPITYNTTGATGATFTGLPAGVTGSWAANIITIRGTPTIAGVALTYTVTLNGGCGAVTATGTITVNSLPANAGAITGITTLCPGQTGVAYSVPVIANATGYKWILPAGATIATGSGTRSITVDYSMTATSGNVTVQGTNSCGNGNLSANYGVMVYPLPTPIISGPVTACESSSENIYSTPAVSGHTYSWAISGGKIIGSTTGNSITVTWETGSTNWVQVTETNTTGCAITTNQYAVTINALPLTEYGYAPDLGTASGFVLFTAIGDFNNVGESVISGDVGTNKFKFTGLPPGVLNGQKHIIDPVSAQAATDAGNAYADLNGLTGPVITTLGNGQVLVPNTYLLGAAATLDGNLILDGGCDPNAIFIIRIGGALSTSASSKVILINSASVCNVYWQIGGAFSTGANSIFRGTAIVNGAITLSTGSELYGRALSVAGAVNVSASIATLVNCNQKLPKPTITGSNIVDINSTGNVYTTESGMTNYMWSVPSGGTITSGGTSTSSTITITWNNAGNQTVRVNYMDTNGNMATTPTVYNVKVMPFPAPIITGPTGDCASLTGNIYSTPSVSGHTYSWAISGGTIIGSATENSITVTWETTAGGWVQVTEKNTAKTITVISARYDVTMNPLPTTIVGHAPDLRTICNFALFTAVGAFTNDGSTIITGDVGTNAGAFTGFPPGTLNGISHVGDAVSGTAATDLVTAYNDLKGIPGGTVITSLNGQTLTPNVYYLGSPSTLSGDLILDGKCDPNALFIIQIKGALSTSASSRVILTNSASLCNVYWQIDGAFVQGENSEFSGTILNGGAITLLTGSNLHGRALSIGGAIKISSVTVIPNSIIQLTSGVGTNIQSACANSLITNITYLTIGASGSIVTGLPAGVTSNWSINTITISGTPIISGIYNYTVALIGGCGVIPATGTITVTPGGFWTGITDTDWNNPLNWMCNQLPSITTNVLIENGKPHYPELSSGSRDESNNLTIESGASLTVSGNILAIGGTITNKGIFISSKGTIEMAGNSGQTIIASTFVGDSIKNLNVTNTSVVSLAGTLNITGIVKITSGELASNGFLKLVSSSKQTALIDGSGNGHVSGKVTMQRYLPSAFGYKYFSSPFSDATISQFAKYLSTTATIHTFYRYNENHTYLGADISGWTADTITVIPPSDPRLNPTEGYAANLGATTVSKLINQSGTVNNGAYSAPLYNHNRIYTKGFQLVGNPYPSPIDWDHSTAWTRTNVDKAIWLFNATYNSVTPDQYGGVYSSYVDSIYTDLSANRTSNPNIIPSMQGFFIHVTIPGPGTLKMTNKVRTTDLSPKFKAASFDPRTILRFGASFDEKNSFSDAFVLYFDPASTINFDGAKDALKMMNTDLTVPNLYSITPDVHQLSINGMPSMVDSLTEIVIGIKTLKSGWITFNAIDIGQLPSNMHIYLIDSEERNAQDLKLNSSYRFYLKTGEYNNRFTLVFSLSDIIEPSLVTEKMFTIIRTGDRLYVKTNLPLNSRGDLLVTNMRGQTILRKEVYEIETAEINLNVGSGIYIITMITGKRTESEKILLRKNYE